MRKTAAPRWAREIRSLLDGIDDLPASEAKVRLDKANRIATRMRSAGVNPRQVMNLGEGADAHAVLMAGRSPVKTTEPLYVAKFLNPTKHQRDRLADRALVSKILGKRYARTHGHWLHGNSGLEIQDFAPFGAHRLANKQVQREVRRKGWYWPGRKLWDVADHHGNVRRTAAGRPVIIDARFDSGNRAEDAIAKTLRERYRDARRQGAETLRATFGGKAESVRAPSFTSEALRAGRRGLAKNINILLPAAVASAAIGTNIALARMKRNKEQGR